MDVSNEILNSIIEGNKMLKRHAEQRLILINKIQEYIQTLETDKSSEELELIIEEAIKIKDHLLDIGLSKMDDDTTKEYLRFKKLSVLNSIMKELDNKSDKIKQLERKIYIEEQNNNARDEVINVLEEHIHLEEATIYKIIEEISEYEELKHKMEIQFQTINLLTPFDPRYKALKILEKSPNGISQTQLKYMLGITPYEANKIITELINLKLVDKKPNSEILRVPGMIVNF